MLMANDYNDDDDRRQKKRWWKKRIKRKKKWFVFLKLNLCRRKFRPTSILKLHTNFWTWYHHRSPFNTNSFFFLATNSYHVHLLLSSAWTLLFCILIFNKCIRKEKKQVKRADEKNRIHPSSNKQQLCKIHRHWAKPEQCLSNIGLIRRLNVE